jgi:hypothetical protein
MMSGIASTGYNHAAAMTLLSSCIYVEGCGHFEPGNPDVKYVVSARPSFPIPTRAIFLTARFRGALMLSSMRQRVPLLGLRCSRWPSVPASPVGSDHRPWRLSRVSRGVWSPSPPDFQKPSVKVGLSTVLGGIPDFPSISHSQSPVLCVTLLLFSQHTYSTCLSVSSTVHDSPFPPMEYRGPWRVIVNPQRPAAGGRKQGRLVRMLRSIGLDHTRVFRRDLHDHGAGIVRSAEGLGGWRFSG